MQGKTVKKMFPKWVTIKTHPRKKRCWFTPAKKNNNKYKSNKKNSHEKFFEFDASTIKKTTLKIRVQ